LLDLRAARANHAAGGIPFVVLIASIATLMQLNRKYELVVTRAAGISAWQFLAPLIIANLLIGFIAVAGLNTSCRIGDAKSRNIIVESNLGSPAIVQCAPGCGSARKG
jgi:lipopolysaccharide export system permease protein